MPSFLMRARVNAECNAFFLSIDLSPPLRVVLCLVKILAAAVSVATESANGAIRLAVRRGKVPKTTSLALVLYHQATVCAFDIACMFRRFRFLLVRVKRLAAASEA